MKKRVIVSGAQTVTPPYIYTCIYSPPNSGKGSEMQRLGSGCEVLMAGVPLSGLVGGS